MANPILNVYLSHAPEGPDWALDGVVDILRRLQATRGKPYALRYGYAGSRPATDPVPADHRYDRHGAVSLEDADIVFAVVTHDYFTSSYINEVERPLLEERLEDDGYAGVFPILVEPEVYAYSWLEAHQPRTIVLGAAAAAGDVPALYGMEQWLTAAEKISERLLGLAAIRRSRRRAERRLLRMVAEAEREEVGYGPVPYLIALLLFGVIYAATTIDVEKFFAPPRTSYYVQERTFRAGLDLATRPLLEQSYAPGTESPGEPDPDLGFEQKIRPDRPYRGTEDQLPETYEYNDPTRDAPRGNGSSGDRQNTAGDRSSADSRTGGRGATSESPRSSPNGAAADGGFSAGERTVPRGTGNGPTSGRSGSTTRGSTRAVAVSGEYGRYESCQGYDENGYRPCKLNRRWYIVNESRDIHHMIDFPVSTHEDIYAIRPFEAGVASVFYFRRPERVMYRSFCVALDDDVVSCPP